MSRIYLAILTGSYAKILNSETDLNSTLSGFVQGDMVQLTVPETPWQIFSLDDKCNWVFLFASHNTWGLVQPLRPIQKMKHLNG